MPAPRMTAIDVTPPTAGVSAVRPWHTRPQRAIARIASPIITGRTVLKIGGQWEIVATPSADQLEAAELVIMGGNLTRISADDHDAAEEAGFDLTIRAAGLYPSSATFPSSTAYPGGLP